MPLSMYQASVPVLINILNNLSNILRIAEEQAKKNGVDPSQYFNARLRPDVVPMFGQVQIVCDKVMGYAARLAGVKAEIRPLTETTFSELQGRIDYAIKFLQTLTAEQIDGTEEKQVTIRNGATFNAQSYLLNYVFPKIYFHMMNTYLTLRGCGVEMSRKDFLGGVD